LRETRLETLIPPAVANRANRPSLTGRSSIGDKPSDDSEAVDDLKQLEKQDILDELDHIIKDRRAQ
jgi:hypothetical protein